MITDIDLVNACAFTYDTTEPPTFRNASGTFNAWLINPAPSAWILAIQGTRDTKQWMVDFEALPVEARVKNHPDLGLVHAGWWAEVEEVAPAVIPRLLLLQEAGNELCITGHSKGAGNALLLAALGRVQGVKWSRISTFGTPHPGALNGLITSADGSDYRNEDSPADPVCLVPFYLPRPRPLTLVNAPLPQVNIPDFGPFISHHCQNYLAAILTIPPT